MNSICCKLTVFMKKWISQEESLPQKKFISVKTSSGKVVRHSVTYLTMHMVGGGPPLLPEISGQNDLPPFKNSDFQSTFALSASAAT